MPAHSRHKQLPPNGFSLIELLVVMVILSLAAGLVVFNLPNSGPSARTEALKLAARLQLLADSAIERGSMTGLNIGADGYHFVIRRMGGWSRHPELGDGKRQRWPENMDIALFIDGEAVPLTKNSRIADITPLIFFTPTGEARPIDVVFEERFSRSAEPIYRVHANMVGDIAVDAGPMPRRLAQNGGRR